MKFRSRNPFFPIGRKSSAQRFHSLLVTWIQRNANQQVLTFFAREISLMWPHLNDFRLFDWQHANTGQLPERSALCGTDWDHVWFELRVLTAPGVHHPPDDDETLYCVSSFLSPVCVVLAPPSGRQIGSPVHIIPQSIRTPPSEKAKKVPPPTPPKPRRPS